MFFSGDPSTRKRVDLGGRSSKESDRRKLIERTRLERNRRLFQKQQNSAASKIQKCFRGRRIVEAEHQKMREQFYSTYGKQCENIGRQCLGPDSPYLRQLLFFFNPGNSSDLSAIVETCRILLSCACDHDDIVGLFAGKNFASHSGLVEYRVRKVAYACIQAVYVNRNKFKEDLMLTSKSSDVQTVVLLETLCILIDPKLPWACKTVGYLVHKNSYSLIREIILTGKESMKTQMCLDEASSVEHVLMVMTSHIGEKPCLCTKVEPLQSFSYQILTIPFIWQICPQLKEVYVRQGLSWHYIRQMALCVRSHNNILPDDLSNDFPGYACLLVNMLESASFSLPQSESSFSTAVDFAVVATYLLDKLPSLKSLSREGRENIAQEDDEMPIVDEHVQHVLNEGLGRQISAAIGPRFLIQLTNALLGSVSTVDSNEQGPDDKEVAAVGSICAFLHVTFNSFPLEGKLTTLAYRTGLVPVLWNFMKRCHVNQCWSAVSEQSSVLPQGAPGWLLPLVVFCPVYKHMLMIVDNEEFYARETPLSLKDIRSLIVILRQALWQILWVDPSPQAKSAPAGLAHKKQPLEFLQHRVSVVASELLSQLQDWNNRRQFASPSDFHADHVNDYFISQAMLENTRANDILKQAPFLVPFTSRVKIFTSQLAAARQQHGTHAVFTSNRFRIRRDHILEDAYNQLSALSDDNLRGVIRISFVNELGVEEAGIDGGGIFKDFMENITRAAFDIQYGLFKETADHLLYPNPGSGLVHDQHLQFFYFLGTILAKAMFESILVDIPFATFFLSKLKQKHNYLNDLPSLDPELYRHLIFLKRYEGDISELELYFVIVNNEYGEQMEEELIPDGKNIRVTNESVIYFIHLVANHRLNYQIRQQSSHFLRGFQQLIQKGWIDMFNEHELQILISGSLDGLDVDDLRSHTQYSGGYHSEHYVIEMFWEVLKGFSQENQMKFLKFVTGCSRGPLLGFKYLEPQFCIQRAAGSASEEALDRLPTSATCMNLLKLPPYGSKEQLERKLLYAINAEAGFDLS